MSSGAITAPFGPVQVQSGCSVPSVPVLRAPRAGDDQPCAAKLRQPSGPSPAAADADWRWLRPRRGVEAQGSLFSLSKSPYDRRSSIAVTLFFLPPVTSPRPHGNSTGCTGDATPDPHPDLCRSRPFGSASLGCSRTAPQPRPCRSHLGGGDAACEPCALSFADSGPDFRKSQALLGTVRADPPSNQGSPELTGGRTPGDFVALHLRSCLELNR